MGCFAATVALRPAVMTEDRLHLLFAREAWEVWRWKVNLRMATHKPVGSRSEWWQVFWISAIPILSVLAVTDPITSKLLA